MRPHEKLTAALAAIEEIVDGDDGAQLGDRMTTLHGIVRTYALATIALELRELRQRGLDIRADVNAWPAPTP